MSYNNGGSIVITSSMSSRIINKSAETEPLTQVRISSRSTLVDLTHNLQFNFPPPPRFSITLPRQPFQT